MAEKPMEDDPEDSPIKEEINIERQLDKRQGLSTIRERVEIQQLGQRGSAIERNITIPLDKKLEEKPTQSSIAQQQAEQEINAYETFLNETGEYRRPRRNQQIDEANQINDSFRKETLRGSQLDEDDEELNAILVDLIKKLNMLERNAIDDRIEFPDILYERERSLLMNTITDDKELDEALEFLKIEYLLTAHENLQNLEEQINNKYDEEIRFLLEEDPKDVNEVLEFLEQERQMKLEHIGMVKRNIEEMSKPPRSPPRRKIFGLSPIQEEGYVPHTPTPQRLPPLIPRPLHESPRIFAKKPTIKPKKIPRKFLTLQKQEKPDRSAIDRMIEARRAAALETRARAKTAQLRTSRPKPVASWDIVSQRAIPQGAISIPLKTQMSDARRVTAEKARAKAAHFRTMKPSRTDLSSIRIPTQAQTPKTLSPKSRIKYFRNLAAEKARADAAKMRFSKPTSATSWGVVSQRAIPQGAISIPLKTQMSDARRVVAEKTRAKAAHFRTMKPSRTDLSSIRVPAQPQKPKALSPKSRIKYFRNLAAEKARADAAKLRRMKPVAFLRSVPESAPMAQFQIPGPPQILQIGPGTIMRQARQSASQYERERVAKIRAAENNLKHRFNEEKEILKQTIGDPNKLEEELEFLKLEYESKLKDLRNIENLEQKVEQRYRQRTGEASDDKELMEFLEEEFKADLEIIQEGVGLRKTESFTIKSILPPSKPKETISAAQVPVKTRKKAIKPREIPSRSTIKLKNKVMRDLEMLQKKSEVNKDVLEAAEGLYTPKVKLSTESIEPLAEKLGIRKTEKVKIILDKARKKTYQVKKKIDSLPPNVAENITKRGIEQLEIDPLQKEEADAIVHTMMLEKSGISMKKDPKDITNLLVPSDAPKVDILGNAIEITENSILAKTIPTREINAINPLASEEIALTLKAHTLRIPPEGIVSKSIGEKLKLPVAKLLKKPEYKVDYLECDIILNSYNVENKFQARGSALPKWFPGFFSAFPDEKVNLQSYKSPSKILSTAWSKMKPDYIVDV